MFWYMILIEIHKKKAVKESQSKQSALGVKEMKNRRRGGSAWWVKAERLKESENDEKSERGRKELRSTLSLKSK